MNSTNTVCLSNVVFANDIIVEAVPSGVGYMEHRWNRRRADSACFQTSRHHKAGVKASLFRPGPDEDFADEVLEKADWKTTQD